MLDLTAVIATESDRFLDAVGRARPEAPVPTCPGWDAEDLLWHLTEVHAYWARVLRSGATTDTDAETAEGAKPARPTDRHALGALYRRESAALLEELTRRSDDEPAWFWLDTARTVGSIRRMQAHEATMHRVDAELTAGLPSDPIAAEVAGDAVAHAFEVMWAWWGTQPGFVLRPVGGVVELAATDLGRSWSVQPGRWTGVGQSGRAYDEPGVVRAGVPVAPAVATVTGSAEELARWLWGRGPEPRTEGESEALEALREVQRAGMQ